jgi:hypothetical protein
MPSPIRITEPDLRQAMRDPRYWRSGHPEREAFGAWVTEGYRGLYPRDAAPRTSVWVKPYTREGHPVAGHWRRAPEGADDSAVATPPEANDGPDIIEADWRRSAWEWLRRGAPDGRGSGGRRGAQPTPPRRLIPGRDGRDRINELRNDPATQRMPDVHNGVPQYSRPGGAAGRQRDIDSLNPVGQPESLAAGRLRYRLEDGRIAISRPATHRLSNAEPTLEIFEPREGGTFSSVDIFRYIPTR